MSLQKLTIKENCCLGGKKNPAIYLLQCFINTYLYCLLDCFAPESSLLRALQPVSTQAPRQQGLVSKFPKKQVY